MKFTVALVSAVLAVFFLGAQAMPNPVPNPSLADLQARGCSCHKVGGEWLCSGTSCV
ncbi:hypothetical protein BDQ17DRAFT_1358845 [Cyathus striatus]|nr:hypothetical protein BDQ17DRAFT_1358845 [Cyathus striatus]